MNYELRCEGFSADKELHEALLLCGRKFVLELGEKHRVEMVVKKVDGLVQSRVEAFLPSRKVSALVRRKSPTVSLQAAINALREALTTEFNFA